MLGTFVYVMLKLQNAKTSLKRFQRMLFGARTEHKRNVLGRAGVEADRQGRTAPGRRDRPAQVVVPSAQAAPCPGHGRNAAQAYSGAPIVECSHPELEPGDRCPQCDEGKVYDSPPKSLVKVVGQAPLGATVYKVQRLRCRLCDAIFTAPLPAAVAIAAQVRLQLREHDRVAAVRQRSSALPPRRPAGLAVHAAARRDAVGHRLQGRARAARGLRRADRARPRRPRCCTATTRR